MQLVKEVRENLLAWITATLAALFALAMLHALVVEVWEGLRTNSQASDRAKTRAAWIGQVVDPTVKLQLLAFESEVKSCMKPKPFGGGRLDDYKPSYWLPAKGHEAERFVLDKERGCVSRVVSRVLIVSPEAGSAIAHVAIEAGYSVSEDIRAISNNDPAALQRVASML